LEATNPTTVKRRQSQLVGLRSGDIPKPAPIVHGLAAEYSDRINYTWTLMISK
jgi:hypothetical protein